jgi:hypothetical protein
MRSIWLSRFRCPRSSSVGCSLRYGGIFLYETGVRIRWHVQNSFCLFPYRSFEAVRNRPLSDRGCARIIDGRSCKIARFPWRLRRAVPRAVLRTAPLRELTSAADEETTPRELPAASRARLQPAQAIKAAMRRGRFLFSTTGYVAPAERARRSAGSPAATEFC